MAVTIPPVVLDKPAGTFVATTVEGKVVLFLREDEWGLKKYPRECPVDLRMGSWQLERVLLVALVLRLAHGDATTFDHLINVGEPNGVRLVQNLALQTAFDVHVVTDRVVRTFRVANPTRFDAGYLVNDVRVREAWSDEEFRAAAARLNQLYPTPSALWEVCVKSAQS